jgi:hypothetical protein
MSETATTEIPMSAARTAADRLAMIVHDLTRALPEPAARPFGRSLRGSAAAVVMLVEGVCRGGGAERAERFLTGAELAVRRLGREVAAAERQGLMSIDAAMQVLERSTAVGVALAALEELLLPVARTAPEAEREAA